MPYLLDTYNVIHAGLGMGGAMSGLTVRTLCQWIVASPQHLHVTLVLDGRAKPDEPSPNEFPDLDLVYSGAGISADFVIAQILERNPRHNKITVVTNDRAVARNARQNAARTSTSEDFLQMLIRSKRSHRVASRAHTANQKTAGPLTPGESAHWLEQFGITPPPPSSPKASTKLHQLDDEEIQRLMGNVSHPPSDKPNH